MHCFILNIIKIVTYKSLDVKTIPHKYSSGTDHYFIIYTTDSNQRDREMPQEHRKPNIHQI
jgi:hypothetical protein